MKDELLNVNHIPEDHGPLAPYVCEQLSKDIAATAQEWEGFILQIQQVEEHKLDLRTFFHDVDVVRVVLLFRENTTEQFASLRRARATGQWIDHVDGANEKETGMKLAPMREEHLHEFHGAQVSLWSRIVAHGIPAEMPVHVIQYEELDKDFTAAVLGVLDFLQVKPDWEFKPQTRVQRSANQNLELSALCLGLDMKELVKTRKRVVIQETAASNDDCQLAGTEVQLMNVSIRSFFRHEDWLQGGGVFSHRS